MAKFRFTTHDWSTLRSRLGVSDVNLLTGNGFSLRYSPRFGYKPLFERFLEECTSEDVEAFEIFKTTNFEEIQRILTIGAKLNKHLGFTPKEHNSLRTKMREGLLRAVHKNHPKYSEIPKKQILSDASILKSFSKVFTTNYDLITYYLLLAINDTLEKINHWKDNFSYGRDNKFNPYYREQTNLFYLHGSLLLLKTRTGFVRKIVDTFDKNLLQKITDEIAIGHMPLFVSGGDTFTKLRQINESPYLEFCLDKLKLGSEPILVFGHGLDMTTDEHIVTAVFNTKREHVFVAVRDNVGPATAFISAGQVQRIWDNITIKKPQLHFISPESVFPTVHSK